MSHGVFVNGQRPKSKKAIKEALAAGLTVRFENTSAFGGEDFYAHGTTISDIDGRPAGTVKPINFVGPDPYTSRKYYGTVEVRNGKVVVK